MQAWDTNSLFRQVHIRMFNPPYTQLGFQAQDDPEQLRKRAHEALTSGAPDTFIEWVKTEVHGWNQSDLCHHLLGQVYKVAGKAQEAKEHLLHALQLRRQSGQPLQIASTLLGLSEVARFVDANEEAWQYLNEAVEVYPTYRSAHLNRLCLASLAKDEEHLRELFEEMCRLYPDWTTDEALCKGLQHDGELSFLRSSALWGTIQEQILCPTSKEQPEVNPEP